MPSPQPISQVMTKALANATAFQMFKDGYRTHEVVGKLVLHGLNRHEAQEVVNEVKNSYGRPDTGALQLRTPKP